MSTKNKTIYLDHAATVWPKPESVLEAAATGYRELGVNPGRSGGDLQRQAGNLLDETREELSRYFNGFGGDRTVFTSSATHGLNIAILGLLEAGDHAVSSVTAHNSVIRPLHHCQRSVGVSLTWLEPEPDGLLDLKTFQAALRPETKLFILSHASNVTGTIQPIEEIGGICRDRGILFLLDAAQTAGSLPIDMRASGIDLLAVSGHKSMLAPAGIGALLLSERAEPRPILFGGTGVDSRNPAQPDHLPTRLECGTVNLPGVFGLRAALEWLRENGAETKELMSQRLNQLVRGLRGIDGLTLHGHQPGVAHTAALSLTLDSMGPETAATFLDVDYGIICRPGLHCAPLMHDWLGTGESGSVRLSCGPWTSEADVDAAIGALRELATMDLG